MPTPKPYAFLSYSRIDSQDGFVRQFCDQLSLELELQTAGRVGIWMDGDIRWAIHWKEQIESALNEAAVFIAIVTPGYFASDTCQHELDLFQERENRLGRSDLVVPIYYVDPPEFGVHELSKRIVFDWRSLRFEPFKSITVKRLVARVATTIRDAVAASNTKSSTEYPSGQRLERIQLRNFRCFEDLDLTFRRSSSLTGEWTCIAGINGAGKSSILQAICIALLGERASELGGGLLARMLRSIVGQSRIPAYAAVHSLGSCRGGSDRLNGGQ